MKIIFAGTPEFAAVALRTLIDKQYQIIAVYTQPDRPSGRGMKTRPSPVKNIALQHAIPVLQPTSLKAVQCVNEMKTFQADIMVVAAYGLILPKPILNVTKMGCINIHASLLPRWRGAAPIIRAIEAGDEQSGICIMRMDEGLDTGDVLAKAVCPILKDETAASLHEKLATLGAQTCAQILPDYQQGKLTTEPQDEQYATYANKVIKSEALVNWKQSAATIERKIRAYNPWPVAFTHWQQERIRLWQANVELGTYSSAKTGEIIAVHKHSFDVATGEGILRLTQIQRPGGKPMQIAHLVNALAIEKGDILY